MANKKKPYNWNLIRPGDIISFRYKTKSTGKLLTHSILVLNPRIDINLKEGNSKKYLVGIKLEESNKISIRLTQNKINALEKIGNFIKIDNKNNLYRLVIKENLLQSNVEGTKQQVYDIISKNLDIKGQYRTYDYIEARKSAVYLEPIRIFKGEN